MTAAVILMWNVAAISVFWAWLWLLWDRLSNGPVYLLVLAFAGLAIGEGLNWFFELGLS